VSEGESTIDQAFHIDRGYPNFAEQLKSLGAKVRRE
jgi:UDP-N-acetylglucosamine 1-carboxyvinyltransferase